MKKFLLFILILALALSSAGCMRTEQEKTDTEENELWDVMPMLLYEGELYRNPYKPTRYLPSGYVSAGYLSEEMAYTTGLAGTEYFVSTKDPGDFYTYQITGTPVSIDEVDSQTQSCNYVRWIKVNCDTIKSRKYTLDDIIFLSRKGDGLSWDDFNREMYNVPGYECTENGNSFAVTYNIDRIFDLKIMAPDESCSEISAVLLLNRRSGEEIDIRTDSVENFIRK